MNAHLASLQEQVDNLYANLNALRSTGADAMSYVPPSEASMAASQPMSPTNRFRPTSKHPSYQGPTSSAFSLNIAKNTLQNMGYQTLGDEGITTQDATPIASPRSMQPPTTAILSGRPDRDPIWTLSKEEVVRLCRVYEEEMGLMYPIINIEQVIIHGTNLYAFIGAALQTGLANPDGPGKGVQDEQSLVLKMVLACATVVEGNGQSEIGYRLFESVREAADRILHSEAIEVKNLPLLVLVVGQNFVFLLELPNFVEHISLESRSTKMIAMTAFSQRLYRHHMPMSRFELESPKQATIVSRVETAMGIIATRP